MTITIVGHDPDTLRALSRAERAAFDLLVRNAATPRLDVGGLLALPATFPTSAVSARGAQGYASPMGGRDETYTRKPAQRLLVTQADLDAAGVTSAHPVDLVIPASVTLGHRASGRVGHGTRAGITCTLSMRPGAAVLSVRDESRVEAAGSRAVDAARVDADQAAAFLLGDGEVPERVPSRVIQDWSGKSRRRMLLGFCSVDWTALDTRGGLPLGMVTLTYPGDWLRCAPSGRAVKAHLAAFQEAWFRAFGFRAQGAWKLEFQSRGAPHFHLLVPVPAVTRDGVRFKTWLSRTWAMIVHRSLDPEARHLHFSEGHLLRHLDAGTGVDFSKVSAYSDPKRIAVYFLKHGTKTADGKEYQHNVPRAWLVDEHGEVTPESGPGRFWGFWGLSRVESVVQLDPRDFDLVRRALRHVAAARTRSSAYAKARHVLPVSVAMQPSRVRKMLGTRSPYSRVLVGGRMQGGFVLVNDGVSLGADLARLLWLSRGLTSVPVEVRRARWRAMETAPLASSI